VEIHIDAAQIEQLAVDALLKSAFGAAVQKAVNQVVSSSSYDSPIDREIRAWVAQVASRLVRDRYAEVVETAIADALAKRLTKEFVEGFTEVAMQRLEKALSGDRF
jgi:HEPN domain-containing protein